MRNCYMGDKCLGCGNCFEKIIIPEEELDKVLRAKQVEEHKCDDKSSVIYVLGDLDFDEITRPYPSWQIQNLVDAARTK